MIQYYLFENFTIYILISNLLAFSGMISLCYAQNAVTWILSVELMFLGAIINLVTFSLFYYNAEGFIYVLLLLILVTAESAIGLSLIIHYFSHKKNSNIESYNTKI
jgi:NADH:ubiquinone oxidoreductase subunit K